MYSGGFRRGWGSLDIHSIGCNERRNDSLSSVVSSSFSLLVVAAALSFATSFVTVRTPGGLVAVRAVVHLRPPRVHGLQTRPQRLVVRPFRHRSRLPIRVDVFLQELLPALAVLLAPHEEVLGLAQRRATRYYTDGSPIAVVAQALNLKPTDHSSLWCPTTAFVVSYGASYHVPCAATAFATPGGIGL
jgi:hypothetical protein